VINLAFKTTACVFLPTIADWLPFTLTHL